MSFVERYLNRQILLELSPTAVFFVVNYGWGLMPATAAVMAATFAAVGIGLALEGRVPTIAVVTLVIVLVLGGASLVFDSEVFIKIRPTVGNGLFAAALAAGLFFRPSFLVRALGRQLKLSDTGWRVLTLCWIGLALSLALLNEFVWRAMDTDTWVTFKTLLAPAAIACYVTITNLVARRYWQASVDDGREA